MDFTKIIKREDGSRIKIGVCLFFSPYASDKGKTPWRYAVQKCLPCKRTWKIAKSDDYTVEEVISVQMEYLKSLEPQNFKL